MNFTEQMAAGMETAETTEQLRYLYGTDEALLKEQQARYIRLIRRHAEVFGENEKLRQIIYDMYVLYGREDERLDEVRGKRD